MAETKTLEIRHRITAHLDGFQVIENFGEQPEIRWTMPTREIADKFVVARREMLCQMIADISDKTAEAVAEARYIDNLKSGRA